MDVKFANFNKVRAELCDQMVNSWDIDLICVSASKASEGSSRAAALELLSEMAKIKPEMVVKKVVDVATTLSRIAGENDDVTLQRALENALKSVVPVWLSSGKADVSEVIWTIVEASTRAPERRRWAASAGRSFAPVLKARKACLN